MSELQRIIVRIGLEADVPSLKLGELGLDSDTMTMRIGDESSNPPKILTTKSTGDFDFSTTGTVTFNNISFAEGGGIEGVDFQSMYANQGILVSLGSGEFRETTITSSDGSVIISNGDGQSGNIDLRVSSDSITAALGDIRQNIISLNNDVAGVESSLEDLEDSVEKLSELTGRPLKATDLGTFLGTIIPDNPTVKTALQSLETAIGNLDNSNFNLELGLRTATTWTLQLTPDDQVTFESATQSLAGWMSAADKVKLDWITVTDSVNLTEFYTGQLVSGDTLTLTFSNDQSIPLLPATGSAPGIMSALDKSKLDRITSDDSHDLDDMEGRITALEQSQATAYLIDTDTVLYLSNDELTSYDIPLAGTFAFSIIYDRVTDGIESKFYDAITLNDIVLVDSENVTKSYSGAITVFKARNGNWYYLNQYNVGVLIAITDENLTTLHIDIGTSNSVTVKRLTTA